VILPIKGVGDRLVERELHGPLGALVRGKFRRECLNTARGRVEADVALERGEVDEVPVQHECRDPVLNRFHRRGRGLSDGLSHLLQLRLNFRREAREVLVDR
jgi:hypothetical protein